ncbi:MAG: N-acetylglucosamine-6-phosphate deacetylase [Thermosipho sp. (in: thermotogales)]|nr:N-acetylglucosamine-6-phosphate deacetylase [Thermosipho sp. (in: thermotogales)]MDN5325095.1 N-acetylglucosamine-6-phosphate deacetylase [Thermosipho sp. (in: thermotogales)]
MIIEKVLIVDPVDGEYCGSVEIEDGVITKVEKKDSIPNKILMPGFVDTHTHGYLGIDCMSASPKEFEKWADIVLGDGVTTLFPTTVSSSKEKLEKVIESFSKTEHPSFSYLHFEGPFINKEKAGAQNKEYITNFSKEKLPDLKDKVKIITAAPELRGFKELIKFTKDNDIKISLGHSNGTFEDFKDAYENEVRRITHFPNALRKFHHREVGGIGAAFTFDFYVELIVDNVHLSKEFVKLVYKIIGPERIILVTDSISAAGLKDGIYELGGVLVKVKDGIAKTEEGTLAGSTLKFIDAVKNFKQITNCSLKELSMVSSYNALKSVSIHGGRIKEGYPAKLLLLDENLDLIKVL